MQVAANEEICQEVAGAGGVQLALKVLEAGRRIMVANATGGMADQHGRGKGFEPLMHCSAVVSFLLL